MWWDESVYSISTYYIVIVIKAVQYLILEEIHESSDKSPNTKQSYNFLYLRKDTPDSAKNILQKKGNGVRLTIPNIDMYDIVSIIILGVEDYTDRTMEENRKFIIRSMQMYKFSMNLRT